MAPSRSREQANQANALQSTGPRTAAGKARSSANAVQHGILSRHLILPGESQAEFNDLLQTLMAEQQPQGTLEQAVVERIAVALWRQRRMVTAESAQVQLQQADLTYTELVRVEQITGVQNRDWIQLVAREPLPPVADVQNDLAACAAWLGEDQMDEAEDLQTLPDRFPRLWDLLKEKLTVETPEEAIAEILVEGGTSLYEWVDDIQSEAEKLLRIVNALSLIRATALRPHESDILSRYQTTLDNDLYKAIRNLRDMQAHRREQAALTATPIEPNL